MSMFGDFLQFVSSVFMGKKDSVKSFIEPLTMAERYLRWGEERKDMRDYASALTQIELCVDEEAPKPDMVVRKYNLFGLIALGAAQLLVNRFRESATSHNTTKTQTAEEKQNTEKLVEASRKRIDELTKEGSLIKAKDEQHHLEELLTRLAHLERTLTSNADAPEILGAYETMRSEVERHCQKLDQAILALEVNPSLPAETIAQIRQPLVAKLEAIRKEVQELHPSGAAAAVSAAAPTPVSPAPATPTAPAS